MPREITRNNLRDIRKAAKAAGRALVDWYSPNGTSLDWPHGLLKALSDLDYMGAGGDGKRREEGPVRRSQTPTRRAPLTSTNAKHPSNSGPSSKLLRKTSSEWPNGTCGSSGSTSFDTV